MYLSVIIVYPAPSMVLLSEEYLTLFIRELSEFMNTFYLLNFCEVPKRI